MRTIKFRGKRIDGDWVHGWSLGPNLIIPLDAKYTATSIGLVVHDKFEVLPESVGQWTGLADRHGKEIFEGDVIRFTRNTGPIYKPTISSDVCVVRWVEEKSSFRLCYRTQQQKFHSAYSDKYEIIGNTHDKICDYKNIGCGSCEIPKESRKCNPELMEV